MLIFAINQIHKLSQTHQQGLAGGEKGETNYIRNERV